MLLLGSPRVRPEQNALLLGIQRSLLPQGNVYVVEILWDIFSLHAIMNE